jgi:hypothetical protein
MHLRGVKALNQKEEALASRDHEAHEVDKMGAGHLTKAQFVAR